MKLATLCVCRNEANRWLGSVLEAWSQFSDVIIAIDDGSTDDTGWLLREFPKVDYYLREASEPMWGNEAEVRQALWRLGVHSGAEWLMVLDADMVPARDPRSLLDTPASSIAFNLYDLWSTDPLQYRKDGFWQAHNNWRIWATRNPGPVFEDQWPDRGIHCGHFPANLQAGRVVYASEDYGLLHFAYSDSDERYRKYCQYAEKYSQLSEQEWLHAASIVDTPPTLASLPFPVEWDIRKNVEAV